MIANYGRCVACGVCPSFLPDWCDGACFRCTAEGRWDVAVVADRGVVAWSPDELRRLEILGLFREAAATKRLLRMRWPAEWHRKRFARERCQSARRWRSSFCQYCASRITYRSERGPLSRFCGRACARADEYESVRHTRSCMVCGKTFRNAPGQHATVCCSDACRDRRNKQKKLEWQRSVRAARRGQ